MKNRPVLLLLHSTNMSLFFLAFLLIITTNIYEEIRRVNAFQITFVASFIDICAFGNQYSCGLYGQWVLIRLMVNQVTNYLLMRLADWLTDWLTDWLAAWLASCLTAWLGLNHRYIYI
uniref:Uncharacterized protein n=1 Tax=Glossina palpalis gambiensis TaxID=67801 RepID=A0A1B0B4A9_9MUSC